MIPLLVQSVGKVTWQLLTLRETTCLNTPEPLAWVGTAQSRLVRTLTARRSGSWREQRTHAPTRDVLNQKLEAARLDGSNGDGPGRQAMVDKGLVPQCPHNSVTSAAAMH